MIFWLWNALAMVRRKTCNAIISLTVWFFFFCILHFVPLPIVFGANGFRPPFLPPPFFYTNFKKRECISSNGVPIGWAHNAISNAANSHCWLQSTIYIGIKTKSNLSDAEIEIHTTIYSLAIEKKEKPGRTAVEHSEDQLRWLRFFSILFVSLLRRWR